MWWYVVLADLLVTNTRAFAPAVIQWGALPARRLLLTPGGLPTMSVLPQKLTIKDHFGTLSPKGIPYFTANPDKTITWTDSWCIEASGDKRGDAVRLNVCNGEPTQMWIFLPEGQGRRNQIQLKGKNMCMDVIEKGVLDGAQVELRECDRKVTESWIFEDQVPLQAATHDKNQRSIALSFPGPTFISCVSMLVLGSFSLGAARRLWKNVTNRLVVSQSSVPSSVEGLKLSSGISLGSVPLTSRNSGGVLRMTPAARTRMPAMMALSPIPAEDDDFRRDHMSQSFPGGTLRVLQYNLLKDSLGSNFVPRTMQDPSDAVLEHVFGAGPDITKKWQALKKELSNEYLKWHPLKGIIMNPRDVKTKVRALWGESDLLSLQQNGWNLQGLEISTATELGGMSGSPRTLLGVLLNRLGVDAGWRLYDAIRRVHETSTIWSVRGAKVLEKIKESAASLVVFQEYDMHELPTAGYATFREAMAVFGYEGVCFRGPGQVASGVGIFWKTSDLIIPGTQPVPKTGVLLAGEDFGFAANFDFEEPGLRTHDRRNLALMRLTTPTGQPLLVGGVHAMTTSRDRTGALRAFELQRMREFVLKRALPEDVVLLCGDFNIDMRDRREENVWCGKCGNAPIKYETGYLRPENEGIPQLDWSRMDGSTLTLKDAYGDVNSLAESSTTKTGTRQETIDYVFYDESHLQPLRRSLLRCPEGSMPNEMEPSDHIPLVVEFGLLS